MQPLWRVGGFPFSRECLREDGNTVGGDAVMLLRVGGIVILAN